MITNLAFITFLGGAIATTQPTAQAQAPAQPDAAAKSVASEKKICRKLPSTGTRMEKRACLTLREWQNLDRLDD